VRATPTTISATARWRSIDGDRARYRVRAGARGAGEWNQLVPSQLLTRLTPRQRPNDKPDPSPRSPPNTAPKFDSGPWKPSRKPEYGRQHQMGQPRCYPLVTCTLLGIEISSIRVSVTVQLTGIISV